jgi:hypothetical protein
MKLNGKLEEVTDPSLKFLPRRYRKRVDSIIAAAYRNGREVGIIDGKGHAKQEMKTNSGQISA